MLQISTRASLHLPLAVPKMSRFVNSSVRYATLGPTTLPGRLAAVISVIAMRRIAVESALEYTYRCSNVMRSVYMSMKGHLL